MADGALGPIPGAEVGGLLSELIRNECVSNMDPTGSWGEESRNAETLRSVLEGDGIDIEWHETHPGRASLIGRIQGSDPGAPSLALVPHTDVVPANPDDGWTHDPFGGELVDGEIWGRGAVDMLNQTAAMALAVRRLADEGFRPRGDLVFWAVPDEECGGFNGAAEVVESAHDLVRTDYALTEVGGVVRTGPAGRLVDATVADKGAGGFRVRVRGRQGHSSLPYGAANPVVAAAEVIRRIEAWQPPIRISEPWRNWVAVQGFDADLAAALTSPDRIDDVIDRLPVDLRAGAHACTRCTAVPTVVHGGDKQNTIPQTVDISVSMRTALDDDYPALIAEIRDLLSDLVDPVDILDYQIPAAASSIDTPLWDVLSDVTSRVQNGATLVPAMLAAQTDARWLRPAGTVTYGFGLLSESISPTDYWSRFHGVDERIDLESLELSALGWYEVVKQFLG